MTTSRPWSTRRPVEDKVKGTGMVYHKAILRHVDDHADYKAATPSSA